MAGEPLRQGFTAVGSLSANTRKLSANRDFTYDEAAPCSPLRRHGRQHDAHHGGVGEGILTGDQLPLLAGAWAWAAEAADAIAVSANARVASVNFGFMVDQIGGLLRR